MPSVTEFILFKSFPWQLFLRDECLLLCHHLLFSLFYLDVSFIRGNGRGSKFPATSRTVPFEPMIHFSILFELMILLTPNK